MYPEYQLGWFPDYSDADNYLTPFFLSATTSCTTTTRTPPSTPLIQQQATTTDPAARTALIQQIQDKVAADLSTVPYLQGSQVAVVGKNVQGAKDTLDASFKFRYGALSKG